MDQLRRPIGITLGALFTLLLTGCGAAPQSAWSHSFDSPEALAAAAVEALADGDEPRLARLALSEDELRTTVWPYLPASHPEVGMDWAYFWRDHAQRSASHLRTLVAAHAGRRYELVAVSFDGVARYGPLTVSRAPVLDVRTPEGPARLRLSGSMAERGGQWKLYSFVVD